jgi:hypothetical protein
MIFQTFRFEQKNRGREYVLALEGGAGVNAERRGSAGNFSH